MNVNTAKKRFTQMTFVLDLTNWSRWGPCGVILKDGQDVISSEYIDSPEDFREVLKDISVDASCELVIEATANDHLSGKITPFVKECADILEKAKKSTCCICGKALEGYGNSPWPVNMNEDARCCDACNLEFVLPARIRSVNKTVAKC